MAATLRLGVLDQSPVREGGTPGEAVAETLALARLADALGYHRYWLAEHHNLPAFAGTAPEVLLARLGAETRAIRIGSGGVMLTNYSALKVAETFRVLEALYPGRVDLGIGRAPGGDHATTLLLRAGSTGELERFPNQLAELFHLVRGGQLEVPGIGLVRANPAGASAPELWLLGSSDQSAAYAAHFGCAFSFAHFISVRGGPEVMAAYRQAFRPSAVLERPLGSACVSVICAETAAEADRLAASRDLWRLRRDRGEYGPFPSVEEALAYPYSEAERARVDASRRGQIIGGPEAVRSGILAMGEAYGVEEILVLTICHNPQARQRSYRLVAEALELPPRASGGR
ncbi:MAG: LLM class flavin-dependent oxidoreductase [Alphaproteobacteria bacterium]